ncbi:MAG: 3-alpha(or 20-beta)-hydroxysteroid dehydrogenase [Aeromicrobium sp.]|nr:3-alpha(or 20-beta)-hydroxysteroid dehydrogenase [Ilumatobacteraceae bacterium]MCW2799790.1 3-alpha(or 20-beta)-hydroxysteroid dehydrogenase [Aeromicrobium sp.]
MRLAGRVAIVTGAAQGQGRAIAARFAAEGARVVVADIADDRGQDLAGELAGAVFAHVDVGNPRDWAAAVEMAVGELGGVDILVNNAGLVHHASLADTTLADYERVVRVNQIGPFLGMQAVAAPMTAAGAGSIVNISSVRGLTGANGLLAYTATKFAVRGMTKVAALELGRHGIRVNSIHPGAIATEGVLGAAALGDLSLIDANFAELPIQRIGRPDDIASLALFLASDESSYCTGAEFVADGGASAGVRRPGSPGY